MREFNMLWAGQTVSLLGSALTLFALPTLAILVLRATPLQVGTLTALETVAFPVLGMFVGVLADRLSRRKIMIVADLARFVALASVPVAASLGVLRIPQLYVVALISGAASAFFGIAYQSYLPVIVSADRLSDANVKLEFSNSGSSMAGSALAGALVQSIGAAAALAVDALSYLVSVATLAQIRTAEPVHDGPPLSVRQGLHEMLEGLRVVMGSSDLRWILCATATTNFGGAMMNAVMLLYAYRSLRLQPGLLGVVYGVAEIGFVGALLSTRVRKRLGLRATLIGSLLLSAVGGLCVLFASVGAPYLIVFISSAIVAMSIPIYNVNQVSYRQALIDVRMQGRMNATMRTFVWGTVPFGALCGGYLGQRFGVTTTIVAGATLSGLSALWLVPLREGVRSPR